MTPIAADDEPNRLPHGFRVLVVHNRYQQRGGEDSVYESEVKLLRDQGVGIETLEFSNAVIQDDPRLVEKFHLAATTSWSRKSYRTVKNALRAFRPHVVHFHNTFPLVSPSAYYAAREEGVRVVQTLHNYRLACLNGLFFRNGGICEDCIGRAPLPGIRHGCYRGSRTASAAVGAMLMLHRAVGTWAKQVDVFIALTQFARRKFIEHGLPAEKLVVKPNFVEDPGCGPSVGRKRFLYVGRLAEEKGVRLLLEAARSMQPPVHLDIIGDGPLADEVRSCASEVDGVRWLGALPPPQVIEAMKHAVALIVPSTWYEGFPRVVVEAFAAGTPVIASDQGGLREIVRDDLGNRFERGSVASLIQAMRSRLDRSLDMPFGTDKVRHEFETAYSANACLNDLANIYKPRGGLPACSDKRKPSAGESR